MLTPPQPQGSSFGTVLIVEDEALISMMIEDFLLEVGASEVIVCGNAQQAGAIVGRRAVQCAILDIGVDGGNSFELADTLVDHNVPFFFATASGPEIIAPRHRSRPILAKPFSNDQLLEFLRAAMLHGHEPA